MRRRRAIVACGLVLGIGIAAGCGGSETVVTVTEAPTTGGVLPTISGPLTTPTEPTTTAAPTTAATTATTATTASTPAGALADLLPPEDVIPNLAPVGGAQAVPSAQDMINRLYQDGDPSKPLARERLEGAGFVEGVLRDQRGNGESSPVLFRAYVMRMGSDDQARVEAQRSVQEIIDGGVLTTQRVDVAANSHARGVRANGTQGTTEIWVEFLAIPRGNLIFGLQAVAGNRVALNSDLLQQVAQHVHDQPLP